MSHLLIAPFPDLLIDSLVWFTQLDLRRWPHFSLGWHPSLFIDLHECYLRQNQWFFRPLCYQIAQQTPGTFGMFKSWSLRWTSHQSYRSFKFCTFGSSWSGRQWGPMRTWSSEMVLEGLQRVGLGVLKHRRFGRFEWFRYYFIGRILWFEIHPPLDFIFWRNVFADSSNSNLIWAILWLKFFDPSCNRSLWSALAFPSCLECSTRSWYCELARY